MVGRGASPSYSRLSLNVDADAAGEVSLFAPRTHRDDLTVNSMGWGGGLLGRPRGPCGGGGGHRYGVVATVQMFIDYVSAAQVNMSQDSQRPESTIHHRQQATPPLS